MAAPAGGRPQISPRTRRAFREALVGEYLAVISEMFEDEGIRAGTPERAVSGNGRQLIEEYYAGIQWTDATDVAKVLRVFEQILARPNQATDELHGLLNNDGFDVVDGRIVPANLSRLPTGALSDLTDAAVIDQHLNRIAVSMDTDPEHAIGASKELIESTCKLVLRTLAVPFDKNDDVPALVRSAQKALLLHPETVADDKAGRDTIKRLLSNLGSVAIGVAELRNLYGTGHGRDRPAALGPRHAHLAVGAATTFCRLLLETLPEAQRASAPTSPGT